MSRPNTPRRNVDDGLQFAFEWRRPFAIVYTAADPRRFAVHLNRYPGAFIGVAFQVGRRVLSIVWGRPGRIIKEPVKP